MQHCGIGIKAFGEVNSVDILNTIIEHGSLAGIVVFSGMNMNIQGNCIEGIEGPAIVSSNMDSLTISNNYFESNNAGNASCHECVGPNGNKGQVSGEHDRLQASFLADGRCVAGPLVLKPVLFGATDKLPADAPGEITNFCDIVLTGALAAGTACMYVVSPTQKNISAETEIFWKRSRAKRVGPQHNPLIPDADCLPAYGLYMPSTGVHISGNRECLAPSRVFGSVLTWR